jgi:D-glycero-D-manno-heptose 1,7-bisphosphate phosphatase
MAAAANPAVFFDRDGTLIDDVGYPRDPAGVRLVDGAAEALAALRQAGFRLVVVSNQSGIGRGLVTEDEARSVHERFVSEFERHGVRLDDVRYCPHAPEAGCDCRKPAPGLLLAAADDLGLDLDASFMVGDKSSDVEAGHRAGCRTILLAPDGRAADRGPSTGADHVAHGWADVVGFVLGSRVRA